jgi:hypothetical protein
MSLVVNKYKIFNPMTVCDPVANTIEIESPLSIPEGTTFNIVGISNNGFVLADVNNPDWYKYEFVSDVFNNGFYKVGDL